MITETKTWHCGLARTRVGIAACASKNPHRSTLCKWVTEPVLPEMLVQTDDGRVWIPGDEECPVGFRAQCGTGDWLSAGAWNAIPDHDTRRVGWLLYPVGLADDPFVGEP